MTTINLREFYPNYYSSDYFIEVPDELATQFQKWRAADEAHRIKTLRYKAYYSLDIPGGVEQEGVLLIRSAADEYESRAQIKLLYRAFASLPDKQAKRIYAHFILGMSKSSIAKAEGRDFTSVDESINRGLRRLRRFFEENPE